MPGKAIPKIDWLELLSFDKFVHAGIFFTEQILLMRFLKNISSQNIFIKWYKITALIFCMTYGGGLELMQYYVFSQRSGDWLDFIANSTGCIMGILTYKSLSQKIKILA